MQVETRFGKVETREFATAMQRSHTILLKDNSNLKSLFEWLKNLHVKVTEDFKWERLKKMLDEVEFNQELKFYLNDEVPMLVFHNIAPLQGDFQNGIAEYLNLFYKAMYSPEEVML